MREVGRGHWNAEGFRPMRKSRPVWCTHPTDHISIESEIRPKFAMLWFKMHPTDHNEILHTTRQCNCRDVCKISLWSVELFLNDSTPNFGRISNSIKIPLVGQGPHWFWYKTVVINCIANALGLSQACTKAINMEYILIFIALWDLAVYKLVTDKPGKPSGLLPALITLIALLSLLSVKCYVELEWFLSIQTTKIYTITQFKL